MSSSLTVSYEQLSSKYIPLGIIVAIFSVIAIAILQYTRRIRKMQAYFMSNFSLFKKNTTLALIATILYYVLLSVPVILLIVWISLLGADTGANPALPILFTFLFVVSLVLPVPSLYFSFKVLICFVLFIVAQIVTMCLTWDNSSNLSFFTLSAILLSINGCFLSISLWLFDGTSWAIPEFTSQANKDRIRQSIQIWKQLQNAPKIIDGGLYYYVSIRPTLKIILTIIFYLLSLLCLLTYSLVGYYHTIYGTIALINSICIITTDLILVMIIFITKQSKDNPIISSIAAMAIRACLIGFTGDYWFLGYCFLYLILGIYLSLLIINKFYPKYQKLPSMSIQKKNIFTMPQMPTLLLQIMFAGAIAYVVSDNGNTLKTVRFSMDGTIYQFWVIGIAFFILSLSIFFYLISLRIVQRSKNRIRSINFYYMGCQSCGQYYFFIFFAYGLLVILGFYMYVHTHNHFIWNSCLFLPLFYQAFILFYANWQQNQFLLLGSVQAYNRKSQKRKQRIQKINKLKSSIAKQMKIQSLQQIPKNKLLKQQNENKQQNRGQTSNIMLIDQGQVQSNLMIQDNKGKTYEQWRTSHNIINAFRENKLLPTDKKIIISTIVMICSLIGYCIVYTLTRKQITAILVSVQMIFLFLTIIPMKRYFCTLQRPNIGQIISFALGIILNYVIGIVSYTTEWNRQNLWVIWWAVINIFILSVYAALALLRDKGLNLITYIVCSISVLLLILAGILVIVLFNSIALGITMIAIAVYYGYVIALYLIYLYRNKSLPQFMHYITIAIIVSTCFAVMIYGFIDKQFDDFLGFSITYLVINLLIVIYGAYSLVMDILNRYDRPNFFSPYGSPIFKYDPTVQSAKTNFIPYGFWLAGWLMYYGYTMLMQIFLYNSHIGVSASSIFLVVIFQSFVYFSTYNVYNAGKLKQTITQKIIQQSWKQVLQIKKQNGQTDININTLQKQLDNYTSQVQKGNNTNNTNIQIKPLQSSSKNIADNKNTPQGKQQNKLQKSNQPKLQQLQDINLVIYDLSQKIQKAIQNQQIALVNLWTRIMLKCQSIKKNKMMKFINFIKEQGQSLVQLGIAIVIQQQLYDIQLIYNHAYQQYSMISPLQKLRFDKKYKQYLQRKSKQQQQNQDLNKKQQQAQRKRQEDLKKKLEQQNIIINNNNNNNNNNNQNNNNNNNNNNTNNNNNNTNNNNNVDADMPINKMIDSPLKMQKMLKTLKQAYVDSSFEASSKNIPSQAKDHCKQWMRPPADSIILNQNTAMSVRQGYLGDCYLISAIGVLDNKTIKKMLGINQWKNAQGSFMVKFKKYGRDVYIIIDSKFPSVGGDQWLFGRCQNKKQIFTNILEKAYAKLYGGYQNIVGGKVSLALADMTGGFPQQIKLKPYQQQKLNQLFNMMVQFKKAGYLMGAGSPQNAQGDTVDVDGIVQGHAYLVLDIRDLDGNKLIKLRNPHGVGGRQSTLDWSDNSPKWTKRLLNLIGQQMKDDGAFWMSIQDFVFSYRALYICRIFDQSIWKKIGPIFGQWKGQSAAGLPTKKFPTAKLANNPHYGIKVTKKSTLFIQLSQNQMDQQRRGKNYIFFLVQKNDGMRVTSNSTNKLCGSSGSPINSVAISGQIQLQANSYPYTFSLMLTAYQQGNQGTFSLTLYCNDKNMQLTDNSKFDK